MGKKKRGHPDLEELLSRPWCYYCERDFDDLKILISHQKAKHFKCDRCGRRLNTAGGLSVHMSQVHKESLSQVDNALPNRSSLDIEIFGMEGVPEDVLQTHNQRVLTQYQQAETERRAATGNPPPGSTSGSQSKKPKFESPSELKKRLAEHKARLAEQAAGGSSGDATPVGAGQPLKTGGAFTGTPQYPPSQQPLNGSSQEQLYPRPFGQPGGAYPPQQQAQPQQGSPAFQVPPPAQQYPNTQYTPPLMSPSQYSPATMASPGAPIVPGTSLPFHQQQQQQQPLRTHTPPQTTPSFLPRPPSLPPAPGLPQRPSFAAPPVNSFQMQQMHHGQTSAPPSATTGASGVGSSQNGRGYPAPEAGGETTAASVDKLISDAARQATDLPTKPTPVPETPEEGTTSKPKKEKAKSTRMVYSDYEFSPEEKMARLPRYAFVPQSKQETALEGSTTATVTNPAEGAE